MINIIYYNYMILMIISEWDVLYIFAINNCMVELLESKHALPSNLSVEECS